MEVDVVNLILDSSLDTNIYLNCNNTSHESNLIDNSKLTPLKAAAIANVCYILLC